MTYFGSMLADVDHVRRLSKDGKADTADFQKVGNQQSAIHNHQSHGTSTAPAGQCPLSDVTTAKRREQAAPSGGRSESSHRDAERGGLAVDAAGANLGTSLTAAAQQHPPRAIQATPHQKHSCEQGTGCRQTLSPAEARSLGQVLAGMTAKACSMPLRIMALRSTGPIHAGQVLTWRDDAAGGAWWTADGLWCLPEIIAGEFFGNGNLFGPAPAYQGHLAL